MKHKVALITGGQKGIGFGIAQALHAAGYAVAMVALSPVDTKSAVAAVELLENRIPAKAKYYQHDIADINKVEHLLHGIEADFGAVTTLVSNAGVAAKTRGDMLDIKPENYDWLMDINLRGGFFLAQAVAKRMLHNDSGAYQSISFVTSVSAEIISIERAEYCLSKAGASMMAKLFATRLADAGIGVFEIRPGVIATDMTAAVKDKYDRLIADGLIPAKRWGQPDDIGQVILPLAEGQMRYASGAIIAVDGGLSINRL